ncbi:MAG TPA: type II toxin-antitoxin system HicA family toxin [Bauldia sp.]|nr:type II toxin-antitoxin system HicA family toxin [Bauldia sp.]
MSRRKLTGLSGRLIVRALQRGGFELLRVSGSHHILARPGVSGARVVVPVHGSNDLPPGTVRSIIAQSGLTLDEFIALL